MGTIRKATSPDEIPGYDKAYWHAKTPEERLAAALKLMLRAKAIYNANPANPPLAHGDYILKLRSPRSADAVERGKLDYVVVGGHAVIAHGYLRTTGDVDIFIRPSAENARRLLRVMERYGYTNGEFELNDFTRVPSFLSFSRYDSYVDLMTFTPGVTFEECFQNRLVLTIQGTAVSFINLRELIKNKRAVGRPQDWLDIDNLPNPD